MSIFIRTAASLLCLATTPSFAAGGVLSPEGFASVRFGMKIEDVEVALKQRATEPYAKTGCDYAEFKKYPGLRFMIEDGVVTRADARKGVKNSAGVSVGMSLEAVKARFRTASIQPHKYDDEGHYVILSTEDGRSAILLEESKGRVTAVRAGRKPSVEYVEGCL